MEKTKSSDNSFRELRKIPFKTKDFLLTFLMEDIYSASDLKSLLEIIEQILRAETGCQLVLVSLFDPERAELYYSHPSTISPALPSQPEVGKTLPSHVAMSLHPLCIENLADFPGTLSIYRSAGLPNPGRTLVLPMRHGSLLIGILEILFAAPAANIRQYFLPYLEVLSRHFALSLHSILRDKKTERLSLEEEKLGQVMERISASLDLDELLDTIIEALHSLMANHAAGIFLLNKEGADIQRMLVYGYPPEAEESRILELGRSANELVRRSGRAMSLRDLPHQPAYARVDPETHSAMIAPILSNHRRIGVFTLESHAPDAYTLDDLALFQKFSHQVALSLEKARLYQASLDKNKLERELAIAREIQTSFLPQREPALPGFELAGMNLPSRLVSGDYYDFIPIVEGQWGLVIGDVAGKGIPAALIMASFRASLLAEIRNNYAISVIMSKVNRLLWESTASNQFVTAFYGVLDLDRRVLTFSNAGHNPGLILHPNDSVSSLEDGGLILGAFEAASYQESFIGLEPGDIFLLYTDGVTEIYNEAEEEFGVERLLEEIRRHRHLSAQQINLRVKERVLAFARDGLLQDDFTLLVMKC